MSTTALALAKAVVIVWCWCLLVVLCAYNSRSVVPLAAATTTLTPDEAQSWRALSGAFDWQQLGANASVQIAGRGVQDADGHLYFVGTKTYANDGTNADTAGDQNIFVARINADDTLAWTKEFGTGESDSGRSLTLVNETSLAPDGSATIMTEMLYVVGTTWGFMDDGAHALNGFGHYGGRDVVLLKLTRDGNKLWGRQFGSSANDFSYGVAVDATFRSLLLSGGCVTDQIDTVVEVAVRDVLEARAPFARYETQMMDPRARSGVRAQQYDFAASYSLDGDLLDFTMDGGVTLTPRRQRIEEGGGVRGEYAVVLNRQPLDSVTVRAEVVQLADPADSSACVQQLELLPSDGGGSGVVYELTFTPSNWNREQVVQVAALDDAYAEGVHFARITHSTASRDPSFNGSQTPFASGRNVTMFIEDNDLAGVQLSRSHMFVGEGAMDDAYDVVLTSKPWHAVTIVVLPLHGNQTRVQPSQLTFTPGTWHVKQTVVVSAVDDAVSENEFGGLHYGGALLHYSESKDVRYHTRRPQCFDVPNCDVANASDCIRFELAPSTSRVRVCDLTPKCAFTLGNGACIASVTTSADAVPARFGSAALDPSLRDSVDAPAEPALSPTAARATLLAQAADANTSRARNASVAAVASVAPPVELRGFVLSFLGLLSLEQAQAMALTPRRVLHTVCAGLARLETHRWAFDEWPSGYVNRVLTAVRAMFPDMIDERRMWNCGVSLFRGGGGGGSSINVTIWDNDPGVTLSTSALTVREAPQSDSDSDSVATYSIVLNAPPSPTGSSLRPAVSMCMRLATDDCGLWGDNFAALAAQMYSDVGGAANVSIAIVANAQVSVSPPLVTFTTANWFVPQWITVRAVNDDVAEADAGYQIAHRVQNSAHGYTNTTAFWFAGTLPGPPAELAQSLLASGSERIPYNTIPTVLFAPSHQLVNVHVVDNDNAGVDIVVNQPEQRLLTKETADAVDWIGDYATSFAFSDVSVMNAGATTTDGSGGAAALPNFLVLGPNATSFLKFHLPRTHEGDSYLAFRSATLRFFQTPFKIFNVSDTAEDSTLSSSDAGLFTKLYRLRITLLQNAWTRESVSVSSAANASASSALPHELAFAAVKSIDVTATVEKSRSIELNVTALVAQMLPTHAAVVSLRVDVLSDAANTTQSVTQICSSLFERKLRPSMQLAYAFPNLLKYSVAAQSSTATSATSDLLAASVALDGYRSGSYVASTTQHSLEPWWQTCLNYTARVGQVAVFLPESMVAAPLVAIASLQPLNESLGSLQDALAVGCPETCPRSLRVTVQGSGVLLWNLQAGLRCLRIYREDTGTLELAEVEAYDSFVSVTPSASGAGLRSRLKTDWTAQRASESWRIQQSAKRSEEENLALGMAARQSSTSSERAFAHLAVDGQLAAAWDASVVQSNATSVSELLRPGSTRTRLESDPWWEVDLGAVKPISSVVLYPFVGMARRGFCAPRFGADSSSSAFPTWSGDLYSYSRTDPLLLLQDPFVQEFEVLITNEPLANASDPLAVAVASKRTLAFSCENATTSVAWTDAFTQGRFVTVRKRGLGVLMLNEVQVLRWNPGATPQYLLLNLYSAGVKPMALSSVQLFAPTDTTAFSAGVAGGSDSGSGFAVPIAFSIHSASSQAATSGAGSAAAVVSVATSDCYIASKASAHEWIVLDLGKPTRVGLIDLDTSVANCGVNVSPIVSISVAAHGTALDGIRSARATSALTVPPSTCTIDAMGALATGTTLASCTAFVCDETACNSHIRAVGATSTLVMSDFSDVVLLGMMDLVPLSRLPLSINEHRALILRDNPVTLWTFDDLMTVTVCSGGVDGSQQRATGAFSLLSNRATKQFVVDTVKEDTHSSNAVVLQPAMPAFSLEFWLKLAEDPDVVTTGRTVNLVTLDANGVPFAAVGLSAAHPVGFFTLTDTLSGKSCVVALDGAGLAPDVTPIWFHIVASYDPATAAVALWFSYNLVDSGPMTQRSAKATCLLAMLNVVPKALNFGAYSAVSPLAGFAGKIASVAWYLRVLTRAEILDHYHDFIAGVSDAATASHNAYALRLTSKPLAPVRIGIRADMQCYRFNTCNASAVPATVEIRPENWHKLTHVHVVAASDQLYEGAHTTILTHEATSEPSYQLVATAATLNVSAMAAASDSNSSVLHEYEVFVRAFYYDLQVTRVLVDPATRHAREDALHVLQLNWSAQRTESAVIVNDPYNTASLSVEPLTMHIIDATVPGIDFSTSSLVVSEDGKGNDYQVVLLSEPTSVVEIAISVEDNCYRACVEPLAQRLCPSQRLQNGSRSLVCGDASTPNKLCNVTIAPSVLYFSATNWSRPQTVRVVAVDDELDESDVHLTSIRSVSRSLDPIYDQQFLPDIVVAVEDNDATDVVYSVKFVTLGEKPGLQRNHSTAGVYMLSLATEPWANVTIAMSNEANRSCYRACGYPFDRAACGLPRQQSVTSVRLSTNSTREIHRIALAVPRVVEVQRIVTFVDHVDQIYRLDVTGGFAPDVQVVAFALSDAFKLRFKSEDAIASAMTYGRTFRLGASDRSAVTASLDGFASAATVKAALDALFQVPDAVHVARTVLYDKSLLQWSVTFARLLHENASFPTLSVTPDSLFEGAVTAVRLNASAAPSGHLTLHYGAENSTQVVDVPVLTTAANLESMLRDLEFVYTVAVTRAMHTAAYGFTYMITFKSVEVYEPLLANSSGIVAAPQGSNNSSITVTVNETQSPVHISGTFHVEYISAFNSSNNVTRTSALPWNASEQLMASALASINGIGNVSVVRRTLSAEGGMEWTVAFTGNNGQMAPLVAQSVNLTASGARNVTLAVATVLDGESLGGSFVVEMGGHFKKTNTTTQRVYWMDLARRNTTALAFNATAEQVQRALLQLNITERADVTRTDVDCDAFAVCNGYIWTISYRNSAGDLPPIRVYGAQTTLTGAGVTLTSTTVANGTYIGGFFSLQLDLFDVETKTQLTGRTWDLPVNVSAIGMDEALEAIPFVRSDREAEFDAETRAWRGIKFDKGVRVYRDGPYLDGGHTWRLEWAIEDYMRFQDLQVTINTSLVTQEVEPLRVPSEFDLLGAPRCAAIPTTRFAPDASDPFKLRGSCVYDIANMTVQERFLCNYTVENPWIVFTRENWCVPQRVHLTAVDDFVDEQTLEHGNVTFSSVTHTVFSDDLIYTKLALDRVVVEVESDDFAEVLVSERVLEVSEDGARDAKYTLQLTTEPLYDVKIVVLPWLDGNQTGCYRFGLCNLTIPTSEFVFTPRDWNVPQTVAVKATDDDLDEYDTHATGISHISYSDDAKYHKIAIPKINVTVFDNDASAFIVRKKLVSVTEGGAFDTYDVVLGSEPFAKVLVSVTNVGAVGSLAVPTPSTLLFTWKNWNVSQSVRVDALDDATEDPANSSSVLVHAIASNDVIYAKLKDLSSVSVLITDNDVSGMALSTSVVNASESNVTVFTYGVRLTSEPWYPVVVRPNANNGCYVRVLSSETLCNLTILSPALYFDASNWSVSQNVSFHAVDDWLVESRVHDALITHSSTSRDPLYQVADYTRRNGNVTVRITDNDVAYVNISLQAAGGAIRSQLHVAEGGFNDSYRIALNSEPYEDVQLLVQPRIDTIVDQTDKSIVTAAQVGVAFGTSSSVASMSSNGSLSRDIELVFTALDWFRPRVVTVFALDDRVAEDATHYSTIAHTVTSVDASYNISNSSVGVVSVAVMVNDKESIPPPVPVTATFDASGSKIQVSFDSSVYHAETMAVRASSADAASSVAAATSSLYSIRLKQFACDLVFNFASARYSLGHAAQCLWLDLKTLRMNLGASATITPNDTLLLNECAAFANQTCQSLNVIRARHTSRAYSQASVLVRVPSDIATPRVVVMAPEEASSCGAWTVDATLSQGGGGRAFTQIYWFALPKSFLVVNASVTAGAALVRTQAMYASLTQLCTKYAADWASGKSSSIFVPKADLAANPGLAFVTTMDTLRSACYLRSLAQAATSAPSLKLQIDSTLVEPGVGYVFGIELTNAFAQRSVAMRDVQVRSLPGPSVFVVGEQSLEVTRVGDPIALQVDSTVTCTEQIGTQVGYVWSVSSAAAGSAVYTPVDLSKANVAKDPRVFRLPRSALSVETSYRFRVETYMLNNSRASNSSAAITVNVTRSALVARITGGARAIGERDALVLNGSSSIDPDLSPSPFAFVWSCVDVTNASLPQPQPCVNATASAAISSNALDLTHATGATLSLPPFVLQQNRTLVFAMTVSKASVSNKVARTSSATTTVWTLQGSVPDVAVATTAAKITTASRVVLSAQIRSTYPYSARWVQTQGDLELPDAFDLSAPTTSDAFALPLSSLTNVILKDKLTPGLTYIFRLVATDVNGNQGFGEVVIRVNSPPSSGRFDVTPKTGLAVQDTFTLSCAEWTADVDDLPLKYAFSTIATNEFDAIMAAVASNRSALGAQLQARAKPLVTEQLAPTSAVIMLPPSGLKDSENITIVAFITDALGSFAFDTGTITVTLPASAKSDPISFASSLLAVSSGAQPKYLLSAAAILDGAFKSETVSTCADFGARPLSVLCSGHGTCDTATLMCICTSEYLGVDCEFKVVVVRAVNTAILSRLGESSQTVEASTSELSQQALIMNTVVQASPDAFNEDGLAQVAALSSGIVTNAFALTDQSAFLNSAGATVLDALSTIMLLSSDGVTTAATGGATGTPRRRLASTSTLLSTALNCSDDKPESAQAKAVFDNTISTLHALTALASQDALSEEGAIAISSAQILVLASAGTSFTALDTGNGLSVKLTDPAIACLDSGLFLSAFVLAKPPHSLCSLGGATQLSASTVFAVHSKAALTAMLSGMTNSSGVGVQTLSSTSLCVAQAAEKFRTTGISWASSRRLASAVAAVTGDSSASNPSVWQPLVALSIPHVRSLTTLEQRNFTTTCQVWNPQTSTWDADICFKDDAASSATATVCYCSEIGKIEVLVTLKERLDYYALTKNLYRNEAMSIVPVVAAAALFTLFVLGSRVGQRMDAADEKRHKDKTIKGLNRAKWSELQQRTQSPALLEDFATFCARKKLEGDANRLAVNQSATISAMLTDASTVSLDGVHDDDAASEVRTTEVADVVTPGVAVDASIVLPNEARTLFGANIAVDAQYVRMLTCFRGCNVLLVLLGAVLAFVGVDFYWVLGNSTSELLLYVYGKTLGLVLLVCGGVLAATGAFGIALARRDATHVARTTYTTLLSLLLVAQLVLVAAAFHYLDDLTTMPSALLTALQDQWRALSDDVLDEVESYYGCCGFLSIRERSACPEEALDAVPPRTCSVVLTYQAQTFFAHSFTCLQVLLIIEAAAMLLANVLVKWRYLRLQQLAGEPTSSAAGETAATRAMLQSQWNVMLLCSLPSLYYLLACVMMCAIAFGVDLAAQLNYISNALVAALFGGELGTLVVAVSGVYLFILLRGIHALAVRDVRALQWFVALMLALLLVSFGVSQFFWGVEANLRIDPAIMEVTEARYLALPRETRVALELAMECCGFDATSEGTCVSSLTTSSVVDDGSQPRIRTCRVIVEQILSSSLAALNTRMIVLVTAQAVVLALSVALLLRLWRFRGASSAHPAVSSRATAAIEVDEFQSAFDLAVRNACFCVLVLLSLLACILGLIVLWAGIDAIYELNVLHISYLLQTFDRRIGAHLIVLGGALELLAGAGVATAWTRSRRVCAVYAIICLVLFVACFGALGVSYRYASMPNSTASAGAARFRLQELWKEAPSSTKTFVQNAFTCCGYDRVETANGSVVFTDMANATFWTQVHESTTTTVYAASRRLLAADGEIKAPATQRRALTETQTRTFTQAVCPPDAEIGCSDVMTKYLAHVARYALKLCVVLLSFLATVLLSAGVLVVRQGKKTPWRQSWRMLFARAGMMLLSFGSVFASLSTLFIALDVVVGWSLFSSSLLQLLFALSIGVTLLVYAVLGLCLNVYSLYAAMHNVVHQLFFQCLVRGVFVLSLWMAAGFTGYHSSFSADDDWKQQLSAFLDRRWNTLSPHQQHLIALDYACCGFHDPIVVKDKGVVFDRPALGFTCPLSSARGCEHVLVVQISSSFGWLFMYMLYLAVAETALLALGALLLQQLKHVKVEEWFAIESRMRYAAGKYRSEARKRHLALSLLYTYDAKFTRGQRLCSILCGVLTTLAIFAGYFATQGCHRTSLKTCEQPDVWSVLGMGLLYGGATGYAAQCVCQFLFELVRHRCDNETSEVATARQRKEKVLLFRSLFQRRTPSLSSRQPSPMVANVHKSGNVGAADSGIAPSTIDTSHSTTEERWSTWLNRFVYRLYHGVAAALFLLACGIATLMGLILVGYSDTLYGVKIDQGPKELLILSLLIAAVSLLAWLAVDMKDHKRSSSLIVFVAVAIACVLLMAGALIGVYMVFEVVADTSDDDGSSDNWTVRKTGFSVVRRLESAWTTEPSSYFRNRVQQELQCCGFRSALDHALQPCPTGTLVQVEYEALSVNGSAVVKAQTEMRDLDGCLPKMLASFQSIANTVASFAIGMCSAQFLLFASAVFLAYDVHTSKDAKLKLRVQEQRKTNVRQTFEKVVGLKIAAPARGKILSKMLSSSLDSVGPTIASELAAVSLGVPTAQDAGASALVPAVSSASTLATPNAPKDAMLAPPFRRPSLSVRRLHTSLDHDATHQHEEIASVPYPASIVYAVFALCGAWIVAMLFLIVQSSSELGRATAWMCIVCWGVGVGFHVLLIEPSVIFVQIIWSTLGAWWQRTWLVRLVRYGREALRIKPDETTAAARYYASLSLYERIRLNAAVRIQRRLLTRVTRQRYLQLIRERRQESHRSLAEQRRLIVKRAIEGFTEEEVKAFSIIFDDADIAKLGLVSHTVISKSIYELGVRVPSERVFEFLHALDPAYADLVDFDHFLYGMHCVRMQHQQEQAAATALLTDAETRAAATAAGAMLKEEFVSSSARFGPGADPQSKVLVKRQNLLRELKEKRESLSYKLMNKVGKLPPLLQRGKTGPTRSGLSATEHSDRLSASDADMDTLAQSDRPGVAATQLREIDVPPTGAFVILQNRKLTPKKRALEMVLKKKHRDDRDKPAADGNAGGGPLLKSPLKSPLKLPSKTQGSPTQRAKAMVQNWKMPSSRGWSTAASPRHPVEAAIVTVEEEEEEEEEVDAHEGAVTAVTASRQSREARVDASGEVGKNAHDQGAATVDSRISQVVGDGDVSDTPSRADVETGRSEPTTLVTTSIVGDDGTLASTAKTVGAVANEKASEVAAACTAALASEDDSAGVLEAAHAESKLSEAQVEESIVNEPVRQYSAVLSAAAVSADAMTEGKTLRSPRSGDEVKTGEVQALDSEEKRSANATRNAQSTGRGSDSDKPDESKPSGAFMLNKQTSSVGKSKIMENILQKKAQAESSKASGSDHVESTDVGSANGVEKGESTAKAASESTRAAASVQSRAPAAAKSSLEKALKKKSKGTK